MTGVEIDADSVDGIMKALTREGNMKVILDEWGAEIAEIGHMSQDGDAKRKTIAIRMKWVLKMGSHAGVLVVSHERPERR